MVYFQALDSGFMVEGLILSNGSMGAKIGAKSAQMEAWRVQNGGPMDQDGGQEGPNATPRASEKHQRHLERAKSMPTGVPEGPAPARARFCVPFWGPRRRKGAEIAPKSGPKAIPKRASFQITFRDRFLSISRCEKHHFRDMKRTPSMFQSKKADM